MQMSQNVFHCEPYNKLITSAIHGHHYVGGGTRKHEGKKSQHWGFKAHWSHQVCCWHVGQGTSLTASKYHLSSLLSSLILPVEKSWHWFCTRTSTFLASYARSVKKKKFFLIFYFLIFFQNVSSQHCFRLCFCFCLNLIKLLLFLLVSWIRAVYSNWFLSFVSQILKTLWSFKALHAQYARMGFTEIDFTHSKATPR